MGHPNFDWDSVLGWPSPMGKGNRGLQGCLSLPSEPSTSAGRSPVRLAPDPKGTIVQLVVIICAPCLRPARLGCAPEVALEQGALSARSTS